MDIVGLLIQLAAGAVGGNVAGMAVKSINQGTLINSIAGIVGGGLGGQILTAVLGAGAAGGGLDITSILSSVAGGGVGGGILLAVVSMIRNAMNK
ncbi:MAG: hypothetical protein AAFX39_16780 [Pseudomonadota bacterium]